MKIKPETKEKWGRNILLGAEDEYGGAFLAEQRADFYDMACETVDDYLSFMVDAAEILLAEWRLGNNPSGINVAAKLLRDGAKLYEIGFRPTQIDS
jgi:hypothetical protein